MVIAAGQHQLVDAGAFLLPPGDGVVAFGPFGRDIAGGEGISAVPGDEGVRLGFGGDPGGLTEVQDDAVRVEDGGDDA